MITPRFKLTQDDKFVIITIRAPYCSLNELDIDIDENIFLFSCKPYYLRLTLPGSISENEQLKSSFDTDSGEFMFTCPKKNPGENFKDLDLITKLLTPKVEANYNEGSINIEVLSENTTAEDVCLNDNQDNIATEHANLEYGFGFAFRARQDFVTLGDAFDEIFEVDPCEVSLPNRRKLRLQYEQGKFNIDHYIADYIEDSQILEIVSLEAAWPGLKEATFTFTDAELDFLKDLPNKLYNLSEQQIRYSCNGLIDILFAYCYDQRATYFEGNVESGWTIVTLAASFSWLDAFDTPKEALTAAFRRSVIYPLHRHFQLSQKVFEDLKHLLSLDERHIIRILINMYYVFLKGDCCRYILNNLFIKDYITYIANWNKDYWRSVVHQVSNISIKKEDLGLNLQEIEDGFTLNDKLASLSIKKVEGDSDDSSEDSSSDSSNDSETDDSDDFSDSACVLTELESNT